jgi:hypothetical protein
LQNFRQGSSEAGKNAHVRIGERIRFTGKGLEEAQGAVWSRNRDNHNGFQVEAFGYRGWNAFVFVGIAAENDSAGAKALSG